MKKILVYMDINDIEYDIYRKTDYKVIGNDIKKERNGNCPNFGNKVWLQGLISEITTPDIEYSFLSDDLTIEQINSQYDCIIKPSANIFSPAFQNALDKMAETFEKIKIPIYIIACGVQLQNYEDMPALIKEIETPAKRFINSVYQSGGEFALRGYITKEFFDHLGFKSAVVTGCPSLFQAGRDLHIEKKQVLQNDFKAVVNSQNYLMETTFYKNIFKQYPNSLFIDQDYYFHYLYNSEYLQNAEFDLPDMMKRVKNDGHLGLELVSSNRLTLFADIPNWMKHLKQEDYAFSFGARIHGNIMSLLSGIPALLHVCDCRTKEMADFYEIPSITQQELASHKDLYELYESLDYTKFNANFAKKYDTFENFFIQHGITTKLNGTSIFENNENNQQGKLPESVNQKKIKELHQKLEQYRKLFILEELALNTYRKIKS